MQRGLAKCNETVAVTERRYLRVVTGPHAEDVTSTHNTRTTINIYLLVVTAKAIQKR